MQAGTLASIKREVEDRQNRKYAQMHHQKSLHHYAAHRREIVTIQRWFRARLLARTRSLRGRLLRALRTREQLNEANCVKKQELVQLQEQRQQLLENKENVMVEMLREDMAGKVRKALSATLDCANRVAYNNSTAKHAIQQAQSHSQACHELSGEIRALRLEEDCHTQKRKEW